MFEEQKKERDCNIPWINFGAMRQEQLDDINVAPWRSQTQWGVVGNIPMLFVSTLRQQQLNHLKQNTIVINTFDALVN